MFYTVMRYRWKTLLLGLSAATVFSSRLHADLESGLEAYWSFDETLSDPVGGWHVRPDSGKATFTAGKLGQALVLGEKEPIVRTVDPLAALDGESAFSLSAWVRASSVSRETDGDVISKGGKDGWGLAYSYGASNLSTVKAHASFDQRVRFTQDPDADEDEWRHVVIVQQRAGAALSVYVNGVLIQSQIRTAFAYSEDTRLLFGNVISTTGFVGGPRTRWEGSLDEVAIWRRALSEEDIGDLYRGGEGISLGDVLSDFDGDGLPDIWEERYDLDDSVANSEDDPDGDGLSSLREFRLGTDPNASDTDLDGLPDAVESASGVYVNRNDSGTNPLVVDTDKDGLPDQRELDEGTDPTKPDTDGDSFRDWDELDIGLDPLVAEPDPRLTGVATTLGKGLVAHWDFNGEVEDRVGNVAGAILENAQFVQGKFGQGLQLLPQGLVDLHGSSSDTLEFDGKSFSVSTWIDADSPQRGAGNPFIQYGGAQSWYVQLLRQLDEDPALSTQSLYFFPGVSTPGVFVIDAPSNPMAPAPLPPIHGGARYQFPRSVMSHIAVVYDVTSNRTLIYINGELSSWQGESGPRLPELEPGLRLVAVSWKTRLDDLAIWERALAPVEIKALYADGQGRPLAELLSGADGDGDGLLDAWEREYALDLSADDGANDPDEDGLTNLEEFALRTNPLDPDSDRDGAVDGVETGTGIWNGASDRGTDPLRSGFGWRWPSGWC